MRTFSTAAQAALEDGSAIVSGALAVLCDPPVYVWGGHGNLTIDGNVYLGVGDRGMVAATGAALGGSAQGITVSLSGVDPDVLPLVDADDLRTAPAVLYRLIFNGAGTALLEAEVFLRSRVDLVPIEETPAGEAKITLNLETPARGLGRKGGRMRTDADQRLVKAADGGMKHLSYAAQKTLYWGGAPPTNAASATGGAYVGSGSGGGSGGGDGGMQFWTKFGI